VRDDGQVVDRSSFRDDMPDAQALSVMIGKSAFEADRKAACAVGRLQPQWRRVPLPDIFRHSAWCSIGTTVSGMGFVYGKISAVPL